MGIAPPSSEVYRWMVGSRLQNLRATFAFFKRRPSSAYANVALLVILSILTAWTLWASYRPNYDLQSVHDAGLMSSLRMLEDFPRQLEMPASLEKLRQADTTKRVRIKHSRRMLESYPNLPIIVYDMSSSVLDSPKQIEMEANLLAAEMDNSLQQEIILVVGVPLLDPVLPVLKAAVAKGGFSGLRIVIVSEKEDFSRINSIFGPSKINARSASYRDYY